MDVKNIFLNGDLHEEVYMTPPPSVPHKFGEVCDDHVDIESLKSELAHSFAMKDLDILRYFLGIEVVYYPKDYLLSQSNLIYLIVTRPDIAHAVNVVSQYFRGTHFHSLMFHSTSSLELRAYYDADWAGDPTDRKSTTIYCIFFGDSFISWKSKKQDVISRSSTEAEYRAMTTTACEIVWLRRLVTDMCISLSHPPLHCDNQSVIQIARNTVFNERTKHIEIDCHVTHHLLQTHTIILSFVPFSPCRLLIYLRKRTRLRVFVF
ncbi:uncharacterized mitochondrial protein AtMg00810-like [Impatiens glandulifera]|uniref:uncharacterized mitochondrial protein AtMg00810-like n=1 Tax=Impatiens glandulifera TaxID=253017 RepID=UPI001FB0BD0D|nr:uncharacterized mitochondrial protein AtMg00810-like [Impatiens glandulifera]